jgi:hypothetical protein
VAVRPFQRPPLPEYPRVPPSISEYPRVSPSTPEYPRPEEADGCGGNAVSGTV